MNRIVLRILLAILIGSLIPACKPASPKIPTTTPTIPALTNTPPSTLEVAPPTLFPTLAPSPAPTSTPAPITTAPGWTTYPNLISIKNMLFDYLGNLWAVGPEGAFMLKPDGTIQHFTTVDGLASNDLLSVGESTDNSIWVGTNGYGAAHFDGRAWQTFTTSDGLAGNVVRDIARFVGSRGIVVATDQGASWYDGEKWQNKVGETGLPGGEVTSIVVPRWDKLWMGTLNGISILETSQTYTTADGLLSNEVTDLACGPDCSLWVGTQAGVSHLNAGTWTSYTAADGLADNPVSAVAISLDGEAWFGTSKGLSRFDGKTWTTFTTRDGLASDQVLSVIIAPNDTLWIGTSAGLTHYSPALSRQGAAPGQATQPAEVIYTGLPLIYIKGGDLWTWSAGVKKQLTAYGNISGFLLSADRSKVAVYRRGENNATDLWVMNLDGSQARLLVSQDDLDVLGKFSETAESRETNSRVAFRGTTWVPGTHVIAYGTYRPIKYDGTIFHDDLNLVDTETGEKKTLLPPGQGGAFTYSPDGSQVAIIGQSQISIMNADGSHLRDKLLEFPIIHDIDYAYYPNPIWSPDGQYLLLALPPARPMGEPTEPATLWKIPADGSPAIRLGSIYPSDTYALYVAYSPDQTRLAYWSMDSGPSGLIGQVHIANYDGTDDKVLISASVAYFVSWSPDGQHFVYYISSGDSEVWYISDLKGNSAPLAIKPVYINWVSNDAFLQYDSLPCARYEMRLTSIHGESQVIDRLAYD